MVSARNRHAIAGTHPNVSNTKRMEVANVEKSVRIFIQTTMKRQARTCAPISGRRNPRTNGWNHERETVHPEEERHDLRAFLNSNTRKLLKESSTLGNNWDHLCELPRVDRNIIATLPTRPRLRQNRRWGLGPIFFFERPANGTKHNVKMREPIVKNTRIFAMCSLHQVRSKLLYNHASNNMYFWSTHRMFYCDLWGRKINFTNSETLVGWSVSRPTVPRVTFDLPE